jgi:hypothetical protein
MKLLITFCVIAMGLLGSWLGGLLDGGNMFGAWSILGGTVGSFAGIYVGYKVGRDWIGL